MVIIKTNHNPPTPPYIGNKLFQRNEDEKSTRHKWVNGYQFTINIINNTCII